MSDAEKDQDTTPEDTGSETTPDEKGSGQDEALASARKRQAGAEAARQAAEAKAADLQKRLEKFEADNQTAAEKDLSELARMTTRAEAAERRAAEAEEKANARILDARFPNARKELPEVTDEVRLAKFEAILADAGEVEDTEPPTPQRHNESNARKTEAKKPESLKDMEARVLATAVPEGWS
jgi:hypothetical protein